MKVRFIGNATVKGVSYVAGDEDTISDSSAKYLIEQKAAVEVVSKAEVQAEEVSPLTQAARKVFQRSKK